MALATSVIVDTGPLVAALNRGDNAHAWSRQVLGRLPRPLLVCEPVVTEVSHLLERSFGTADDIFELFARGLVVLGFELQQHLVPVRALMQRYADMPMSLADACIVRMSELRAESYVLTLDEDFSVYRRNGRQIIPVISPRG